MGFFSSKEQTYLGLTIGSSSIALVELAIEKRRPSLSTYGTAVVDADVIRNNDPKKQDEIVEIIKKLIIKSNVKTKECVAALPTFAVFNSLISIPLMEEKDIERAIKTEIAKLIPLPIEDVTVDWKLVSNPITDKKTVSKQDLKILVTAAPKKLIARYARIFEKIGLKLIALESEPFALVRSLMGNEKTPSIIVDLGNNSTDIIVVDGGIPIFTRSINFGGKRITDLIARTLGVEQDIAEQYKVDLCLSTNTFEKMKEMPEPFMQALGPFFNEIKYIFDLYRNKRGIFIEKIILTGGTAFVPYLPSVLSQFFDLPCFIGNPWAFIRYDAELQNLLLELGPTLAVPIGLALRQIKE